MQCGNSSLIYSFQELIAFWIKVKLINYCDIIIIKRVLVTGDDGHVWNHSCAEVLEIGYEFFVIESLSNGDRAVLELIRHITNSESRFINVDFEVQMYQIK